MKLSFFKVGEVEEVIVSALLFCIVDFSFFERDDEKFGFEII